MSEWIHAGSLEELKESGAKVIKGGIAVFIHEQEAYAVDNRCPHMGFPLHMGSLCDGILTCHWHHARFDVCSGGTLDPWADDVPVYRVKVEQGEVWVHPQPQSRKDARKHLQRLREGLEQNISLVIAKAVVALMEAGTSEAEIAKIGVEFGTTQRAGGWSPGLTILTTMVNILPKLDAYGRILALFHGLVHVARDCAGRAARFMVQPLPDAEKTAADRLSQWYRQCIEVRDSQGAERILLTAIRNGADQQTLADMMMTAVTDHFFLDGGHTLDFHNKAFEILQHVGKEQTELVLTSLVQLPTRASRAEERQSWQQPINLIDPLRKAFGRLDAISLPGLDGKESDAKQTGLEEELLTLLLGDQPLQMIEALTAGLEHGMAPARMAQLVALAAAERITKFHIQNEFGDWITVLHTFTHAHAVHESLLRSTNRATVRAIYYAAVSLYLDRFLNVPAAPRPNPHQGSVRGYMAESKQLLEIFNQQQQVTEAGDWLAHYLQHKGNTSELFNTLGHALLREDAEFHSFQMYEAACKEYDRWSSGQSPLAERAGETMLLALTRYLAAHAPTARELPNTARIAWRLHRDERLFEAE